MRVYPFTAGNRRVWSAERWGLSEEDIGGYGTEIPDWQWWLYQRFVALDRKIQKWIRNIEDQAFMEFQRRAAERQEALRRVVSIDKSTTKR